MEKYKQIIQDILDGIERQDYKRGEKLPSIRQLSLQYECSKDTVQKAMQELKYQNKIYAVEKSGYYVLDDHDILEEPIDLDLTDFEELPYEDFRICLHQSLIGRENYLFNYYHQQAGLTELITSVQLLLMDYHVYSRKDQLVITAGSQQALYILSQLDFGPDRTHILIESPTYTRMEELIRQQGLPYLTIQRSMEGIDLDRLEDLFKTGTIKFFYTIPRLHNPLGTSYDRKTMERIVQLAKRYQVYLIEDDYLADFDGNRQLPLHYLDKNDFVVYIKSFSPTLFPALRIGAVSLPPLLLDAFLTYKGLIDYDTNLIMQKALSLYIDNGMFTRNTQQLREQSLNEEVQIQDLIKKYPLAYPYQVVRDQLIVQFPDNPRTARLEGRHQLIRNGTFAYLLLRLHPHLEDTLKELSTVYKD